MNKGHSKFNFVVNGRWPSAFVLTTFVLLFLNGANLAGAQQAVTDEQNIGGPAQYQACVACHGSDGSGNKALSAPTLAGASAWYVQRQLLNFKSGVRGSHSNDQLGKQMASFAAALSGAQIVQLAEFIAAMPMVTPAPTIEGNLTKGHQIYIVCGSCHGASGQGNKALNSPRLTGLNDWYIVQQLQHFKSGVRGQHEADTYGLQMAKMAQLLTDDEAAADVTVYINSLPQTQVR